MPPAPPLVICPHCHATAPSNGPCPSCGSSLFENSDATLLDGTRTRFDRPGPDDPGVPLPRVPGSAPREMPLVAGQNLGDRYHIVELLGLGGMGAVYQAWDAELGVVVAVKVIRPAADANPETAQALERRFKQELLLARQVT